MKYLLTIMIVIITLSVSAQRRNPHMSAANRLYKEGQYDKALIEYLKARNLSDRDAVITYNLGNAYYRTSKFNEAENAFSGMLTNGASPSMTQAAWYNKGVALSKQGKLEESIEAYKMAVKMDPDDENARINLQKALSELAKKTPPPPPQKNEEKKKQQNKDQRKQPPQSKLTKKQVEQLLKALQQREQQVQQKMQQRQRTAGQQEKDW